MTIKPRATRAWFEFHHIHRIGTQSHIVGKPIHCEFLAGNSARASIRNG